MKSVLWIAVLAVLGFLAYRKFAGGDGPPAPMEDPVYGEMRIDIEANGRSVEAALFVRASSSVDCHGRAMATWALAFKDCKQCSMRTPSCKDELPARYAKLFDDVPIASTYLSANAGRAGERDGRIVIFGLTDEEGIAACEAMRKVIEKTYQGETYCVEAAGG